MPSSFSVDQFPYVDAARLLGSVRPAHRSCDQRQDQGGQDFAGFRLFVLLEASVDRIEIVQQQFPGGRLRSIEFVEFGQDYSKNLGFLQQFERSSGSTASTETVHLFEDARFGRLGDLVPGGMQCSESFGLETEVQPGSEFDRAQDTDRIFAEPGFGGRRLPA